MCIYIHIYIYTPMPYLHSHIFSDSGFKFLFLGLRFGDLGLGIVQHASESTEKPISDSRT